VNQAFANTNEDGEFSLKNEQPGRFRVQCSAAGFYVKSAAAGELNLMESPLDTTQGLPSGIVIRLGSKVPEVIPAEKTAQEKAKRM